MNCQWVRTSLLVLYRWWVLPIKQDIYKFSVYNVHSPSLSTMITTPGETVPFCAPELGSTNSNSTLKASSPSSAMSSSKITKTEQTLCPSSLGWKVTLTVAASKSEEAVQESRKTQTFTIPGSYGISNKTRQTNNNNIITKPELNWLGFPQRSAWVPLSNKMMLMAQQWSHNHHLFVPLGLRMAKSFSVLYGAI